MKRFGLLLLASVLGSLVTVMVLKTTNNATNAGTPQGTNFYGKLASNITGEGMTTTDFTLAANKTVGAVVHIKSKTVVNRTAYRYRQYIDPFEYFFGNGGAQYYREPYQEQEIQQGSGSGVVITPDGYIVTNNHVVAGASELEVVLNDNKSYTGKVVGTDPSTDIAVIKIDGTDLPALSFADSDNIQLGEWVLAIGNPFNLSTTVTAGIVSAKARNINIISDKAAIESFIQTDAAVNPGNSGGALVNLKGELIGINTAIATPNGTFAGYSFAVPSNLAAKVVDDLINYGNVQRAFLGVQQIELNSDAAQQLGINQTTGVYINKVLPGSAAADADLREKDIIVKINNIAVSRSAELLEQIGRQRPGDKIDVTVIRNDKEVTVPVTLKNSLGNSDILLSDNNTNLEAKLGINLVDITPQEKQQWGIDGGAKVAQITNGKVAQMTNMREGFVITGIDGQPINSRNDLINVMSNKKGGVMLEGFYPGRQGKFYYAIGL